MKFITNNSTKYAPSINYKIKYIEEILKIKLMRLHIDDHQKRSNYTDKLIS